jgi:hypothetical protein
MSVLIRGRSGDVDLGCSNESRLLVSLVAIDFKDSDAEDAECGGSEEMSGASTGGQEIGAAVGSGRGGNGGGRGWEVGLAGCEAPLSSAAVASVFPVLSD